MIDNAARDAAIIALMRGAGLRTIEVISLDICDIAADAAAARIIRKGGAAAWVEFSPKTAAALCAYIAIRQGIVPLPHHTVALFLSAQRRRITARAVQDVVKKRTFGSCTPHNLRALYATGLYRQTRNIYHVAAKLGHKHADTAAKHYVRI